MKRIQLVWLTAEDLRVRDSDALSKSREVGNEEDFHAGADVSGSLIDGRVIADAPALGCRKQGAALNVVRRKANGRDPRGAGKDCDTNQAVDAVPPGRLAHV
jgi:hypothetical protein